MTDITELAQSLKAAADREMICRDVSETSEIWERIVTPENILALVEALESEKRICATWRKTATAVSEKLEKAQQRIAELESRTVKLPQRHITQFRKGFNDYHNEMVYKVDEVLVSLAAAGIEVEAEKIRIVLQELKEDGVLTTYSNGHVEMLPYRIDENGEEYVEMFPNDIELH
ncbi:hypothetical protein EPNKCIFM_00099 [Klebsiella phage KP13-16]|nr:hypothetical protein EPNKCIFM_00099 [Klebsiella phage KP13-16]